MDDTATTETHDGASAVPATDQASAEGAAELLDEELLVEEISIDGMCGVY